MNGFAKINSDLSYWQKQSKPLFPELEWNIPEQKIARVAVFGGNSQSFSSVVRTAELLNRSFPFKQVATIMPDALRNKLPVSEQLNFAPSTNSGSFARSPELRKYFDAADFNFVIGDLSHNAETASALTDIIKESTRPILLTRDAIDLLAPTFSQLIEHPGLFLVGSMSQLQKVFRALYYPRMIMLSQPLLPLLETLHKFTLTYNNVTILTFHQDNIIVANGGKISTTLISNTDYAPIALWSGQLASKIVAMNLFNPNKPFEATTTAILYK